MEYTVISVALTPNNSVDDASECLTGSSTLRDILETIDRIGARQSEAEETSKQIKILQEQLKPYADMVKHLTELVSGYAVEHGIDPNKEFTLTTGDFVNDTVTL